MTKIKSKKPLFKSFTLKLTIYQRVALLLSIGLFVFGLILVLFINFVAPLLITREVGIPDTTIILNTVDVNGTPVSILAETPAPLGYTISQNPSVTQNDPLSIVRLLSIVGLVLFAGVGFLASRWLAKVSLNPIVQISQKTQFIDARSLNQRLSYQGPQDDVKVLADTIDAMLTRLSNNFERQGQFIGNLAHELRTPLSSLRMNIDALILDPEAKLEDYHKLADIAERALSRLEHLVEDLLLLAKGENEIAYGPIVIGVLIDEILEEMAPVARDHKISLSMNGDIDSEIYGDPALLQCAISNLIKNGVLYNHPGGFVEVVIHNDNNKVIVEVRDNGIGITNEDQSKIFERFYRVNKRQVDGIYGKGLGLAIVKHIVELHQGNIDVESELGAGSTFRISLPKCDQA